MYNLIVFITGIASGGMLLVLGNTLVRRSSIVFCGVCILDVGGGNP